MKTYIVYILLCRDGTYYTGVINDLERRMGEHVEGYHLNCYTINRRPLQLVYSCEFREVLDAIAFEKQVKGWSRKKKEALIRGDYEQLPPLSWNAYRLKIKATSQSIATQIRSVMLSKLALSNAEGSKHRHD